ncbi:DNA cytosine methyltransferase [Paenibacillus agricola]|uniref:DNA (cytosine-5-)-methyltransferase n=1 Tax=Paenibacillus agricola TaxID=2716264 RepID=A0ABX0JAE0_9BACL|nr:DNA (cytosine-5-)-methyltransferase [Paenibacillus agricola]NHN31149.1 DNA (cytosine-5-)-methyltransferase [Paenibacillus agricola]
MSPNGLTAVEFYAGGGLQSIGVKAAGYRMLAAYEWDKNALAAYRHNHGSCIVQRDIAMMKAAEIPDADTYILSPPCQTWSVAGKRAGLGDKRGKHMLRSIAILSVKRPPSFWIENVKGMLSKKFAKVFDRFIRRLSRYYNVSYRIVNAWDYGVAQRRERVLIVGIRKDRGFTFKFPETIAADHRTQTLRDVIGDLPAPNADERNPQDGRYSSQYLSRNRIVAWDKPAFTVLTSARDASIHPGDGSFDMDDVRNGTAGDRRFTVRECLRIQSVPDSYALPSEIPISAQYRIVGNGVASRVAYVLGAALAEQLNENKTEVSAI